MKRFLARACLMLSYPLLCALPLSSLASTASAPPPASALFAGGCFWSMEADFEKLAGVLSAESGYTGGKTENPTYRQVIAGASGHVEAVRIVYDPARVSYAALVEYFWRRIDPGNKNGQFCDSGTQYRSAIFYQNERERDAALASRATLQQSGRFYRVYTEVLPAARFYPAEAYHQDYYKKNPSRYRYYLIGCRRDQRLARIWEERR
jgi:peptide-methionine (S)-S-oxide reductase